jgi:hypothetical protein
VKQLGINRTGVIIISRTTRKTVMLAGADGGNMEKIAGEKAIVNYKEQQKNGKIDLVIANSFLVKGF